MTREEFINQFDTLYNNISSNQSPGLDEYEKSVFLTKAQDEIVKAYFTPNTNKLVEGYDGGERRQIDFSMITTTDKIALSKVQNKIGYYEGLIPDAMMIINEFVVVTRDGKNVELSVLPLSYREWSRLSSKPYKRPTHYQAWRIIESGKKFILIIGNNDSIADVNTSYTVRYVRRPYPIILQDLTNEGLSINGKSKPLKDAVISEKYYEKGDDGKYTLKDTTYDGVCELDPILHEEILQRAVELAKAAYTGGIQEIIQVGNASATNIGIVPQQQARQ